jgi:hypothetical protein
MADLGETQTDDKADVARSYDGNVHVFDEQSGRA